MKTIAPAAMAAIEAGEAIVTGAVEITPRSAPTAELSWMQHNFTTNADEARMGLAFFDAGGVQIGDTHWSGALAPVVWTARSLLAPYPEGVATIRLYQERTRVAGAHNDGYIDAISLKVAGVPQTVINPGAEDGVTGWTNDIGTIQQWNRALSIAAGLTGAADTPDPYEGSYFFAGEYTGIATILAHQDIAFPDAAPSAEPIRLWGGYGPITIDAAEYQGIGARGLAQQNSGAIGGVAQGLTLSLSGIEPAAIELLDSDELKGAAVVLYRLIFASDGKTLLDANVFDRGRVDTVSTNESIGADARIEIAVESAARGLGRAGGRMRSDSDQRLIDPDDGYFKETAYAGQKTLYWGGKRPFRR